MDQSSVDLKIYLTEVLILGADAADASLMEKLKEPLEAVCGSLVYFYEIGVNLGKKLDTLIIRPDLHEVHDFLGSQAKALALSLEVLAAANSLSKVVNAIIFITGLSQILQDPRFD